MAPAFSATAWNNRRHHASGAGYGLKITAVDRDAHMQRSWGSVDLHFAGYAHPARVTTPDGQPRTQLRIEAGGRVLMADLSAKSVRKSKAAIGEHGVENVAVIVQRKLVQDRIEECGLSAQLKGPKPAEPPA